MIALFLLLAQDFTTTLPEHEVRVKVLGFASAAPAAPGGEPERVPGLLDCVVVGGGMSGLTAAFYLQDLKVLVLERDERAGGLAQRGSTEDGVAYARGSAFYAEPPDAVRPLYLEMGLGPLEETLIPPPADASWSQGKLILDPWQAESLKALPPEFRIFHARLLRAHKAGEIPAQPLERAENLALDLLSAADFIRDLGPELKAYLDARCRSALGGSTEDVSALAFANVFRSRILKRYAWPGGTGGAALILARQLKDVVRTGAAVTRVAQDADGVDVDFLHAGKLQRVRARQAILAVPPRAVDALYPGLPEPRRALIRSMKFADYVVHQIFTSKDHWTRAYATGFADTSFTDLIAARWVESKGFKEPPASGPGILSVVQPLAGRPSLDPRSVNDLAIRALQDLYDVVPELLKEKSLSIESYRWPAAIHVPAPRFFSDVAPRLRAPDGRVRFAGSHLGTPSFEEAIFRGHQAALEARAALGKGPAPRK